MTIDWAWVGKEKRLIISMTKYEAEQLYQSIQRGNTKTGDQVESMCKRFYEKGYI